MTDRGESGPLGPDGRFDERIAARYDENTAPLFEPAAVDPVVDFLVERAKGSPPWSSPSGRAGSRYPSAQRGVPVHGIDVSRAMVARLQAKPGGERIGVTIGDFATTRVDGSFTLAYLVYNTIMNVTTQSGQVATFRNVAEHLEPGGCFVVEVTIPELRRLPPGERSRAFHVGESSWGLDEYDVAAQGLVSHHYDIVDGRVAYFAAPFRYVWPSELDLMAEMAGMRLRERWGGWKENRSPARAGPTYRSGRSRPLPFGGADRPRSEGGGIVLGAQP